MSFLVRRFQTLLKSECEKLITEAKISGYEVRYLPILFSTVCVVISGNRQMQYAVPDLTVEQSNLTLVDHVKAVLDHILRHFEEAAKQ